MSALDQAHFVMLQKALDTDYVPHLLPLLDQTKPAEEQKRKNQSRAFGAFALSNVCSISATDAGGSVVDDFDDFGVDAIYYHAPTETLCRYVVKRMNDEEEHATGQDRLVYRHGVFAVAWVLAKRIRDAAMAPTLIDQQKLEAQVSAPFDQLRQTNLILTKAMGKGALALFRNQTDVTPLVEKVAIEHYGLGTDSVVAHKQKQQKAGEAYPEELFTYLVSKAPQIGNLS